MYGEGTACVHPPPTYCTDPDALNYYGYWPCQYPVPIAPLLPPASATPSTEKLVFGGYGSNGFQIKYYDLNTHSELGSFTNTAQDDSSDTLAIKNGKMFATGVHKQKVGIWDVATRQPLGSANIQSYYPGGLGFSSDGTKLYIGMLN